MGKPSLRDAAIVARGCIRETGGERRRAPAQEYT